MKTGERIVASALGLGLILGTAACSNTAPRPDTSATAEDILGANGNDAIGVGGAIVLHNIPSDSAAAKELRRQIPLIDNVYENGPNDPTAPVLGDKPIRIATEVIVDGKRASLSNDAACETVMLDPGADIKKVGGVAIGGAENGTFLTWPEGSENALRVCFFQDMEASEHGVVLFSLDRLQ